VIPSSNFTDGLKHTAKGLSKGTKKAYYDAAGKPYLTCNKCNAHVPVAAGSVSKAAPSPMAAEGGKGSMPAESAEMVAPGGAPGAAPSSAAGGSVQAAEGTYNGEAIVCPSCKNPIEA
jgi:hypothetical protein